MSRHSRGPRCSQNEVKTASASALNWPMWCPTRVSKSLFFLFPNIFSRTVFHSARKKDGKSVCALFCRNSSSISNSPSVDPYLWRQSNEPRHLDTRASACSVLLSPADTGLCHSRTKRAICSPQASANRRPCASEFAKVALTLGLEAFAEEATDKLEMKSETWDASPSLATPAVMVAAGLQESPRHASHKFL